MEQTSLAARGARIAEHPHPQPTLRRITAGLIALGLAGDALGVIGLLLLAVIYTLPLLGLMALILAGLSVPLIQLAIMHPRVTVYERGLWLEPLLWRGVWVPWAAIRRLEDHTLIRRGKEKDRQTEHFGQLIVVEGALPRVFAVVGGMAGSGWGTRAFGISTHSHVEYAALLKTIRRHITQK